MAKCWVEWHTDADKEYWICRKYMMGFCVKHPPHSERCYIATCPGRTPKPERNLPPQIEVAEVITEESPRICAAHNCEKPVGGNKENHCSEACRRRANRYAYKQRQKAKRVGTSPTTPAE